MNEGLLFLFFIIAVFVLSIVGAVIRGKLLIAAVKAVRQGVSPEQIKQEAAKNNSSETAKILRRVSLLIAIGFIMFWFWMWMRVVGQAIPMPLQNYVRYGILAFQAMVAGLILIRGLLMLVAKPGDGSAIGTVIDTKSNWEVLEGRLILIAFFLCFIGAFLPVYFLMKQG